MINPDVFFKTEFELTGNFIYDFALKNLGAIGAFTAILTLLILWVLFWNVTKDWKVLND